MKENMRRQGKVWRRTEEKKEEGTGRTGTKTGVWRIRNESRNRKKQSKERREEGWKGRKGGMANEERTANESKKKIGKKALTFPAPLLPPYRRENEVLFKYVYSE